jgi:hypothetical protein
MAKLFGELLVYLVRVLVVDLIAQAVWKFCVWLDMKIPGRWPRIIVAGFMGLAAYFAIPIIIGLLGL